MVSLCLYMSRGRVGLGMPQQLPPSSSLWVEYFASSWCFLSFYFLTCPLFTFSLLKYSCTPTLWWLGFPSWALSRFCSNDAFARFQRLRQPVVKNSLAALPCRASDPLNPLYHSYHPFYVFPSFTTRGVSTLNSVLRFLVCAIHPRSPFTTIFVRSV